MTAPDDWTWASEPPSNGWFAVVVTWDAQEGLCLDALSRVGGEWLPDTNAKVLAFAGPFSSWDYAQEWAYSHDPEG